MASPFLPKVALAGTAYPGGAAATIRAGSPRQSGRPSGGSPSAAAGSGMEASGDQGQSTALA